MLCNPQELVEQIGANRNEYKTAWKYDVQNRPKRIYYKSEVHRIDYSYDGIGRIRKRIQCWGANEYVSSIGYVAGANGGNTSPLVASITQTNENHNYTYDDVGNILSVKRGNVTVTYSYDNLGQLTRVNDPNDTTSGSTGTTWTYEYDRGGNMLNKKRYAYTTGNLGNVLQTITYTYGDSNWKDKLTAYNGQAFSYDAIGNVTSAQGWTYTWRQGRELVRMAKGTPNTAGYEELLFYYNQKGRRVGKTHNVYDAAKNYIVSTHTEYTWVGDRVVHLVKSVKKGSAASSVTETLHFHYDGQGKPAMVMYNGTRFGYVYNAQGDVIGLITGGHSETVKYTYDAWGKLLSISGARKGDLGLANPFRYRGYIYDDETEMYYLQTRYYKPEWNRFINADVIYENNLYTYCSNNPIRFTDPHGARAADCRYSCLCADGGNIPLEKIESLEGLYENGFSAGNLQKAWLTDLVSGNTFMINWQLPGKKTYHVDFYFVGSYPQKSIKIAQRCLSDEPDRVNWNLQDSWSKSARPGILTIMDENKRIRRIAVGYVLLPHHQYYANCSTDGEMCMFFGYNTEGYAIEHGNEAAENAFNGKYMIVNPK